MRTSTSRLSCPHLNGLLQFRTFGDPGRAESDIYDWIHPNPLGQSHMALAWFAALRPLPEKHLGQRMSTPPIEEWPSFNTADPTLSFDQGGQGGEMHEGRGRVKEGSTSFIRGSFMLASMKAPPEEPLFPLRSSALRCCRCNPLGHADHASERSLVRGLSSR